MKAKYLVAMLLLSITVVYGFIVLAQPPTYKLENERSMWVDEHWRKIVIGAEAQMVELLGHTLDAGGPPGREDIDKLVQAGYTMANTGGFAHYWYAINNRKPPLDDPKFRTALAYAINKEEIYGEIYGPMVLAIYNWAPPAQAFWCNPQIDIDFPHFNLQTTIDKLIEAEYEPILIGGGGPVPDNIASWNMPNGDPMRDIEQSVPVESTNGMKVSEWIERDLHSIGLPIYHTPKPFNQIVYEEWLVPPYLSWDCTIGIGLTFGFDPVLYEMYHVDCIPFANIWGLDDATVNAELEAYRETLDWNEAQSHAFAAADRLSELMPMIPVMTTNRYTCNTGPYDGEPGVLGIVNMIGYGTLNTANDWAKLYSRREDGDGNPYQAATWIMGEDANVLNPLMSDTTYEWAIMASVYNGFYIRHPYTHELLPWCVETNPEIQIWNGTWRTTGTGPMEGREWIADDSPVGSPGAVIGEYMRWTLRDDMTWHDGTGVNASDVEFCLDLLVKQNNERYDSIQRVTHDVEIISEYVVDVYMTARYLWADNDIAGVSLLTPKHIWKPYIAGPDGDLWTGDDRDHRFWAGHDWTDKWGYDAGTIDTVSGTVDLTHLQGNGYNIYPLGGWVPDVSVRLIRWNNTGWGYTRILRGDNNLDGYVDVLDLWAPFYAGGSVPGMPQFEFLNAGLKADMANDAALIDGRDTTKVYDDWDLSWYP